MPGDLGVGVGVAVVGGHTLLRVGIHHFARAASDQKTFLRLELGGLGVRAALVLGTVAAVLLYAPVHKVGFTVTVIALLVLSVTAEIFRIGHRMS